MDKLEHQVTTSLSKDVRETLESYVTVKDAIPAGAIENLVTEIVERQNFYCKCRTRKCGPHRCWPSIAGWSGVGILLFICWYLIGGNFNDSASERKAWQEAVEADLVDWETRQKTLHRREMQELLARLPATPRTTWWQQKRRDARLAHPTH